LGGRGQKVVVPLQVKPPPAALEEGVEADVLVLGRGIDVALRVKAGGFVADLLPVLLQEVELGKFGQVEIGLFLTAEKR
jgi:hypothetical protein